MKKLLFFDIDGTLYNSDKQVPKSTKRAIQKLQDDGHIVAIATGRAPFLFEDLRNELNIDTFVSLNGQYAVVENEVIYKNPIAKERLEALTEYALKNNHPLVYLDEDNMASNFKSHKHIDEGLGSLKFNQAPIHAPDYYLRRDIFQALLFCEASEEGPYIEQFSDLDFLRWHPVSLDVMPKGGTKAMTVKKVQKTLNIDDDNVYAFGDGPNDYEMLKMVKHSVAMANGVENTKSIASFVTNHVDNNGLENGLKHFNLI